MQPQKKYILSLDEVREEHLFLVGNKFKNLSHLYQKGYLVPPAFCLIQRAWEVFLQRAGLEDQFEEFSEVFQKGNPHQSIFEKAAALSQKIESLSLPLEIEEEVRYAFERLQKPLAIRSSGLEEDLGRASFAGIHTSFLNVSDLKEVLERIRDCWKSMFSEYSLFYRLKQAALLNCFQREIEKCGIEKTFGMGVFLQEMVQPVYSGVLFTFNPVLGRQEIMVEVQEGEEAQENFTLCRTELRVIERKSLEKKPFSLPPQFLRNLGKLGLKIEEMFGVPQDIEWVYREGKIYVLQSRPITSLPGKDEKIYWTAANSQEVLWKPVTPLTFTFFTPLIEKGRSQLFRALGIEKHFKGEEYLGLFYGRPYFNINYFNKFLHKLDISGSDLFDTLIFGQEIQMEAPLPRIPFSKKVVKLFWKVLKTRFQGAEKLKTFCRWFQKNCHRSEYTTLPPKDRPLAILRFIRKNTSLMEEALHRHVLGSALAGAYFFGLGKALHFLKIDPLGEGWTTLASGIPGIHSALEGRSLLKLAKIAREYPAVEYLLLTEQEGEIPQILPKVPGGNRFLRKMDEFLEEFGHRSLMEADLSAPRRKENPSFLFKTLRKYLEMDSLEDREEENTRRRIEMTRQVLKRASQSWKDRIFPWKQLLLGHLMKSLVAFMPYRENLKDMALKPLFSIRQGFLRLEEHFIAKGILKTPGDIFFLDHEEVVLLAQGSSIPNLQEKIEKAKKISAQHHSFLAPQLLVVGREGEENHQASLGKGKVLVGLGCSPGIVTGKARVVVDNQQIHSLKPGEILITRTADPAMTPLFLLARAVVMDVGGALSHSVVVAREYGIPCVTALREGTHRIHTGDSITVDGAKGLVYLS